MTPFPPNCHGPTDRSRWAAHLSKHWMEAAGTLYVDGHVRVYHGSQTMLPRRYISRQRLCLRGVSDYWVNDGIGRPFFVVEKTVDPGLLEVLRTDIVREGYSPAFFQQATASGMHSSFRAPCHRPAAPRSLRPAQ